MATVTLDPIEIERVVSSSPSDTNGSYRQVWFFGDIVIKRDNTGGRTNRNEFAFYEAFEGASFEFEGEDWEIVLPKTALIGEYIVMEKVEHPFLEIDGGGNCGFCKMKKEVYKHLDWEGKEFSHTYYTHADECCGIDFLFAVDNCMSELGIGDTHEFNFMVDAENNRVYFIDFAQ